MMSFLEEDYYGNIEYKLFFDVKNKSRLDKYITQLNFRLNEGHGEAIYIIGIFDNGSIFGLNNIQINYNIHILKYMCNQIKTKIKLILLCNYNNKKFIICKLYKDNFISNVII